MGKIKNPLLSLVARNTIGKAITFRRSRKRNIAGKKPEVPDVKSLAQLSWRHMYQKAVALWHALSAAEKEDWESQARRKHMTGFAWFISQALKPNPGLYLPLQGGTMTGDIAMSGNAINTLKDPVAGQDGDTKAARDAAITLALGGSLTCDVYGWDGANWQKLRVESAAQHNLRVRLYGAANAVRVSPLYGNETSGYALLTKSITFGTYGVDDERIIGALTFVADNLTPTFFSLQSACLLFGYNGASYDRLRSWGTGVLKVGRAEIDSTTVRKTAAGQAIAGARKLYWIACSPDSPGAEWELTDAIAGGGAVVYDHFDPDKHSEHLVFDPPMKFATGIWIEKFDHMRSLVFCYV